MYDVIVVGSGFAGLAAALESRLGGAEVLLIEKMPAFGGNSAINGGAFSVAGSPLQKKFGIKDSPEQMLADMIRSGRGLSHVDLLKMVVEGSLPAYEFTLRHGVKYKDFVQHFGGHSVPRTLQTVESTGGGITRPLTESCRKHGVELHLRAKMEEFIRDDDGRVVGLVVRERYLFPNEESGVLQRYGARKGVTWQPAVSLAIFGSVVSRILILTNGWIPRPPPVQPVKACSRCLPLVRLPSGRPDSAWSLELSGRTWLRFGFPVQYDRRLPDGHHG